MKDDTFDEIGPVLVKTKLAYYLGRFAKINLKVVSQVYSYDCQSRKKQKGLS